MLDEEELHRQLVETESRVPVSDNTDPVPVTQYADMAQERTWQQKYCGESRTVTDIHSVSGRVWSDAIEKCLSEHGSVFIPDMDESVYIDRPVVLKSGNRLTAHPEAEIRLMPSPIGTCMVRNESVVCAQEGPVDICAGADTGILIEGGIWNDQLNEGRGRGGRIESMVGAMGVFVLSNISQAAVRNICFRDCSAYAVQIGNAHDFAVEDLRFDETADGVHVEGPAHSGIIRCLSGKTNDDVVALNAWDWDWASLTFGPITDILVENVEVPPGYTWSEARLLPGTKVFAGGETVDCDIRRCMFRNIRGIHKFKMYDQPNLNYPEKDFADPIGRMSDLFFADIVVDGISQADYYDKSSDAVFDICTDIDSISLRDIRLNYVPGETDMARYLVSVGPKSLTWPRSDNPEDGWKEVLNPNANPVVDNLTVRNVFLPDPDQPGIHVLCTDPKGLIYERCLSPNPDFPRTLPRGGTGQGRIVNLKC